MKCTPPHMSARPRPFIHQLDDAPLFSLFLTPVALRGCATGEKMRGKKKKQEFLKIKNVFKK